jgi:hypothetical protein
MSRRDSQIAAFLTKAEISCLITPLVLPASGAMAKYLRKLTIPGDIQAIHFLSPSIDVFQKPVLCIGRGKIGLFV